MIDDDHIRVCNCANGECKRELVSEKTADLHGKKYIGDREVIWGRHKGRPYCRSCYTTKKFQSIPTRG